MGCLCCGAAAEVGALCRACAKDVVPCEGLIADHVRSTVPTPDASAWAVDGFGNPHALADTTVCGRQHDGGLVVLAASVSREHAELRRTDAGWVVRDLGSRNGTFVDGTRAQGRVTLPERALVKLGDVALWFLAEVAMEPAPPASLATGSAGGLVRYNLAHAGGELCVIGGADAVSGGSLLFRKRGADAWTERGLSTLELQLLRALCVRSAEEASSPSTVRGCVPTKQLARDLTFQSKYANEENVRQVVRRVREVLAEAGADGVLAVAPGRGYYLTCAVEAS
jgi:hypothetical protein